MYTSYKEFRESMDITKISKLDIDIELEIDLKHSIHSIERKGRHNDKYITNEQIKETFKLASEKLINAILKDWVNINEKITIYNPENDLNIVGALSYVNRTLNKYIFKVVTVMIKKDFKTETYRIVIDKNISEANEVEINSNKAIALQEYEQDIKYYNSNKSKLEFLKNDDITKLEEEANEIINGNKYLGLYWKLVKLNKTVNEYEEKLKNSELTNDEKKTMQDDLREKVLDMNEAKKKLDDTIKTDLNEIKKL